MKLYVHSPHTYEERAKKCLYIFPPNHVIEVPDEIGIYMLTSHPAKFCDVSNEAEPEKHECEKGRYVVQSISQPPLTTQLKPNLSKQKRLLLRKAMKRSRNVRLENRS